MSVRDKKKFYEASVQAVFMGHLPIRVTKNKPGMVPFPRVLAEALNFFPVGKSFDVEHILPSNHAVIFP